MTIEAPKPSPSLAFEQAVEFFLDDAFALGRLTTARSAAEYRRTVRKHAADAAGLGPVEAGREQVKATLRLWEHPNTKRRQRSMLVSFYDWMVEEGLRSDNPARQVRAPRAREPRVRRLTLDEVRAVLAAAAGRSERRIVYLAACAGLRCSELRLLQGLHFARGLDSRLGRDGEGGSRALGTRDGRRGTSHERDPGDNARGALCAAGDALGRVRPRVRAGRAPGAAL